MISQNQFFIYKKNRNDFVISKIRFCDIKNSSFDYVMSLNRFLISRHPFFYIKKFIFRFCDITKYFVFVMSQNRGVYSKTAPHTIRRLAVNG